MGPFLFVFLTISDHPIAASLSLKLLKRKLKTEAKQETIKQGVRVSKGLFNSKDQV